MSGEGMFAGVDVSPAGERQSSIMTPPPSPGHDTTRPPTHHQRLSRLLPGSIPPIKDHLPTTPLNTASSM